MKQNLKEFSSCYHGLSLQDQRLYGWYASGEAEKDDVKCTTWPCKSC